MTVTRRTFIATAVAVAVDPVPAAPKLFRGEIGIIETYYIKKTGKISRVQLTTTKGQPLDIKPPFNHVLIIHPTNDWARILREGK